MLFKQISPGTEFGLYANVGEDIVNVIREKGTSSRDVIHLLSSICGVMTRKEAQKLLGGSNISTNRWRSARQYRRQIGPAMPNLETKLVQRRRRVEEKSIQDFVEWLNMNGMLQSLAYGEKIIKYTNGFHVAIESVKRTQSVVHIIRRYYRDFLSGRAEDDADKESCFDADDDNHEQLDTTQERGQPDEQTDDESEEDSGDETDDESEEEADKRSKEDENDQCK